MSDQPAPIGIVLLQTILTFSGAIFAPIMGVIAGSLASGIRRKKDVAAYKITRLGLIEKAVKVGLLLKDNNKNEDLALAIITAEYTKIIQSIPEPEWLQFYEDRLKRYNQHSRIYKAFMLPKPISMAGWIYTFFFYIYVLLPMPFILLLIIAPSGVMVFNQRFSLSAVNELITASSSTTVVMIVVSATICLKARDSALSAYEATLEEERVRVSAANAM